MELTRLKGESELDDWKEATTPSVDTESPAGKESPLTEKIEPLERGRFRLPCWYEQMYISSGVFPCPGRGGAAAHRNDLVCSQGCSRLVLSGACVSVCSLPGIVKPTHSVSRFSFWLLARVQRRPGLAHTSRRRIVEGARPFPRLTCLARVAADRDDTDVFLAATWNTGVACERFPQWIKLLADMTHRGRMAYLDDFAALCPLLLAGDKGQPQRCAAGGISLA